MVAEWTTTDDGRLRKADGRLLRAGRTRDRVVRALFTLLHEGKLRPTAREVADRGGVSLRSVFQHFDDMESLYATLADMQMERLAHLVSQASGRGDLKARLSEFVERRGALLETITPVRRAAILQEPFSEVLAQKLRWAHHMARGEVQRTFEPELAAMSGKERDDLLWALDAASNWATWDSLRRMDALSAEDSKRVMLRTLNALLKEVN